MNAIEVKGLGKRYKDFELKNIDLTLPSGCIMGLVGENGAGKTTTVKLILGMLKKDSGSIRIFGRDTNTYRHLMKEDIGVVLDDPGIPMFLNAIQMGKIMKATFKNWDEEAYNGYLKKMSLPPKKKYKDYSKGMKMKLAIAIALSHNARLLILDEATSGLDPVIRDDLLDIFSEFTRDEGHAVLISSHIVSDLEKICDYVAFMHQGRLLLCEEKDRLREEYGLIHCSREQIEAITQSYIIGKKENAYGVEAIVKKCGIPSGIECGRVDIEELFIFMVKGEDTK